MARYLNIGLALIAGVIIGSVVNLLFVHIGPMVIAPPEGIDMSSAESLKANAYLLEPKHYLFPLIAHTSGTYVGALIAIKLAKEFKQLLAYLIAALFFMGGITAIRMIPAPIDFILVDLIFAYFPMAYAAIKTLEPHPHEQLDDNS